jgi:hypothetical protein
MTISGQTLRPAIDNSWQWVSAKKTGTSIVLSFSVVLIFSAALFAEVLSDGWSRQEAEAKLGVRVECISNPNQELLQWGPRFEGWDRSMQPKALGRPVKVGSRGAIKEILRVSEGKYKVVVHWHPEAPGDPFWATVIGPAEYNLTISSIPQSHIIGKWREIGRAATVEFLEDGTFKAVDNEGLAVAGKYTVVKDGNMKFQIQREGTTEKMVNLGFSIVGDELTLTPSDGGAVERYRKEK